MVAYGLFYLYFCLKHSRLCALVIVSHRRRQAHTHRHRHTHTHTHTHVLSYTNSAPEITLHNPKIGPVPKVISPSFYLFIKFFPFTVVRRKLRVHPAEPVLPRSQGGAGGGALPGAPPPPVVPPGGAAEEEAGGRQFEREKSQRLVAPRHNNVTLPS